MTRELTEVQRPTDLVEIVVPRVRRDQLDDLARDIDRNDGERLTTHDQVIAYLASQYIHFNEKYPVHEDPTMVREQSGGDR